MYVALTFQFGWAIAAGGVAQAQAADSPGYRDALQGAQAEFGATNYQAALEGFERADRLFSNARTQFGIGRSHFELRNYVRAIEPLRTALRSEVQPLDERSRPIAEELLKLAERSVARFTIDSKPREVSVAVDGVPIALPVDRKLTLNAGPRLLEVGASDYESQRLQLMVKGGEDRKLAFALEPSTAWYADPWVWIGAGVLLAGATTAIVVMATSEGDGNNVPGMSPGIGP